MVIQALLPFAIIGSEEEIELNGALARVRIYPWGVAEVDNPKHSDFSTLRRALLKSVPIPYKLIKLSVISPFSTHLTDLKVRRIQIYTCFTNLCFSLLQTMFST